MKDRAMADSTQGLLTNLKVSIPDISKLPVSPEIKQIDAAAGQLLGQTPAVLMNISLAVVLIVAGWLLCGWLASWLNRVLVKAHMEETLAAFLASTARFVTFFSIFTLGLSIIGFGSASMAAFLGAIGLAVGFALRGTLGNIAGGVMLMVHRPLKVGDWVENTTVSGTVKRIGLFSTEVNTQDFVRVFIPNALLWENILRNHTYNRMRMVKVEFGLGHEVNVAHALGVIKQAMAINPLVLKTPDPVLGVDRMDEHGVMCTLEAWTRTEDRRVLRNTLLMDVMDALHDAGIRMAYQEKNPPAKDVPPLKATKKRKTSATSRKGAKV